MSLQDGNVIVQITNLESPFGGVLISSLMAGGGAFTLPLVLSGMRIKADGTFQLFNPDQNTYHTLQVRGLAGAEYITIGPGEP